MSSRGALHHLELWVDDLETAEASLGWLFVVLGYEPAAGAQSPGLLRRHGS